MEFQQPLSTTEEDDENISNDDSEEVGPPSSDELRTYIIIVNDDGSLSLDPNGIVAEDADPQSVIPVHLPVNKMKSADCPLPGATPFPGTSRARKTKPQATLYGGDIEDQEPAVTSTGVSAASAPIDIAQLGPQDIAILENVLQSEQAREMRELMENMSFPSEDIPTVPPNCISHHSWDHSYSNLSAPPPQPILPPPTQSLSTPGPLIDHMSMAKSSDESRTSTPAKISIKVPFHQTNKAPTNPTGNSPAPTRLTSSPVLVHSPSSRRVSEVDDLLSAGESNAIKRRSQRQQDRIERLEAERIMAENQQMLQREKELMMENSNIVAKQREVSPAVAAPAIPSIVSVRSASPIIPIVEDNIRAPSPVLASQTPAMPSPSPSADEIIKSDNFKRPIRHRKLPAHLADPNYLHLDEDVRILPSKNSPTPQSDPVKEEEEEEEPDKEVEESEDEEADEEVEEDDPNKLWCICRKPHNNRFMICCDKCDDWFHGKCVGVTKAQATQMEANHKLWHCPTCRKSLKQQTAPSVKTPKTPGRASSRRGSTASQSSTASATESKEKPEIKKVTAASAIKAKVSLAIETPKRRESVTPMVNKAKPVGRRKSDSVVRQSEANSDEKVPQCIVCGTRARVDSVYCSDDCVRQHATTTTATSTVTVASKPKDTIAAPVTPSTPSPSSQKLKRLSSIKDQERSKEAEQPFFAFHVIQAGAAKSTEIVPPRQKEPAAGAHAKPSQNQTPNSSTGTSPPVPDKTAPSGAAPPKLPQSPAKSAAHQGQSQNSKAVVSSSTGSSSTSKKITSSSKESKDPSAPAKDNAGTKTTARVTHEKNGSKEKRKVKESPKELEKERDARHGRDGEALMKDNFKKTLRETFKDRLKNVTDDDKVSYPPTNTPENMAEKIIEELTQYYGSANNVKGKAKYRSIIFNLRDAKNSLFREILQGNISAKTLVKMEATEMASAELSEWRNRENQKNLEMIKKAELDKLVEAKKQELIDKGADVDVAVEEQAKQNLDIADVIQLKDKGNEAEDKLETGGENEKESSSSKSSHRKDKKKDKRKEKDSDRDKLRDSKDYHPSSSKDKDSKDRQDKERRSDRHRHRSSRDELKIKESPKDKESSKDKTTKDKDKSKLTITNNSSNSSSGKDLRKDRDKDNTNVKVKPEKDTNSKIKIPDSVEKMDEDIQSHPTSQKESSITSNKAEDSSVHGVRHSTDSEQELPSSTIKTPDFTDEPKKENVQTSVFRTKLIMHELGHFHAVAYNVSHNSLEGTIFPESPVPIVGRISPETVWDYIDKMKKTKEVIVLRLAPASEADSQGYMTFFSYLSSRGRLGVMGGISPPLKDVYLIPLNKHSPINRALLPFRGPGLPKERNHCLLAVVTRHIMELPPTIQPKRKASLQSAEASSPTTKKKRTTDAESPSSSTSAVPASRQLSKDSPNAFPSRAIPGSSTAIGPLADPRRKGEPEPELPEMEESLQNDDDQPYTPWEDEDDKDPEVKTEVSSAPITSVLDDKTAAQKLLDDLNRKIQMEKQQIESIAVAIKRNENITHIPGLDGDFPKEHSPVSASKEKITDDIPFFLRSQPIQSKLMLPIMTEPDSEEHLIPTTSDPQSNVLTLLATEKKTSKEDDCITVIDDEAMISKPISSQPEIVKDSINEVVELEDEDEAYSPSAMDFSDDESEKEKDKEEIEDVVVVKDPRTIPPPKTRPTFVPIDSSCADGTGTSKVVKETVSELVTVKEVEPQLSGIDRQIKIPGLDFSDSFEKDISSPSVGVEHSESQRAAKSKPDCIDLDVDELEEPPPPGESVPSPAIFRTPTKPALDSVFSLGPPPNLSPKVKIQINLAPKNTTSGTGSSSVLAAVSSAKPLTTPSILPPMATSVTPLLVPDTLDIPLPPSAPPKPTFNLPPPALSAPLTSSVTLPLAGMTSISIPPPPVSIQTNVPPPHLSSMTTPLPVTSIPPPSVAFPPQINADTPPGFPRTPNLIPAPPIIGGVSINTSIPPPPPIAGMVPVSAIPPLPTLRGMPSLTPIRFASNIGMTSALPQQQQPQLNRFRPMGRYPVQSSTSSFPPKTSPPERGMLRQAPPLSPGSSSSGSSSNFERKRNNSFNDKNDGSDSKFSSNYQKGSDRFRNSRPSYTNRHRSRSRSGSRSRSTGLNRSRSRSRDRNRNRADRRHRRRHSRSRSPSSSSPRRISRTRSPSLPSNRKSPPRRRTSKSRSPSTGRNRRSRRSRSSSPVTSSSSGKI